MQVSFDILGFGSVALDDILVVDRWPAPDEKMRVRSRTTRLGGLTGLALVAAAKAGAKCAYVGRLGVDPDSKAVAAAFEAAGIDVSMAVRDERHGIVRSTIVSALDGGTRNVFSHASGLTGAADGSPAEETIAAAKVLLVDHHGVPGSLRAAKLARGRGVAVVADFERNDAALFPELLAAVDHLVLSRGFACRITGTSNAEAAVRALWTASRAVVIVTCGTEGCWFSSDGEAPEHFPAMRVEARDTSGCGDVFHGAYAAALAKGNPVRECIRLATEAAGKKAAGME